jgi:hypothetical protein
MIENLKSSLFLDCERCGALWDVGCGSGSGCGRFRLDFILAQYSPAQVVPASVSTCWPNHYPKAHLLQELHRTNYSIGMQHIQQVEGIVCF